MLPSEYESFGWVLLEAWARRKPVLGNRFCAPVAAVISDGEDGYLCANATEMAQRVAQLIAQPDLAQRLGQAGYDKIARRYTWDVIGRRVRDLYVQLTDGRREPARQRWVRSSAKRLTDRIRCKLSNKPVRSIPPCEVWLLIL